MKVTYQTCCGIHVHKGSFIPCKAILILRKYTHYRYKLVSCRFSGKNPYPNVLTVCNVALDAVVSDIFGKLSTSIIDYLLEQSGTSINHEEIASKLLKTLKSKEYAVIESIEGYQMTNTQKYCIHLILAHMDYTTAEIHNVDSKIEKLISSDSDYENAIQFLCSILRENVIVQSLSSPKLVLICLSSSTQNIYVVGLVLHQTTTNLPVRRNLFELNVLEFTTNLH